MSSTPSASTITRDTESPRVRSRRLTRTGQLRLLLVGYGIVVALLGVARWNDQLPTGQVLLQTSRQANVADALNVLDQGGPPLVAAVGNYKQAVQNRQAFAPDATDDPGIYLYLPVAGHLFGDRNPLSLIKWFFIGCMALVLLAYPILFYLLFDSLLVALAAPLVVLFDSRFLLNHDIYFIQSWAVLLLMPVVLVVAKLPWRRGPSLAVLAGVAIAASFASSVRGQAGTGVAIAALAVAVFRERGWRWRTGAAVLVIAGYLLVTPLGFDAIRAYGDHQAHVQTAGQATGHPFWHPMYLGLGLLPNKWGIQWNDTVGADTVAAIDPSAGNLSPRYESILRHLYFKILKEDPGYVARVYAVKASIVIRAAGALFWLPLLLAPLVLVTGRRRKRFRREFLLLTPALLLAFLPPVLTVPGDYDVGFLGALGLVSLLAAAGLVLIVRDWIALGNPARWRVLSGNWPAACLTAGIALVASLGILALGLAARAEARSTADEYANQFEASILRNPLTVGAVIRHWDGKTLDTWYKREGVATTLLPTGALRVTTIPDPYSKQMISEPVQLTPGSYAVVADGAVTYGGLELGALDPASGAWLALSQYWSGQAGFEAKRMEADFTVTGPQTVQVALGNWVRKPTASSWVLRSVELVRLPARGR